ncbi:Ig-like domain-containing protein [Myxococcota bacterium]|nr:Ig-like domain-containing protein [Myxococcota bacterium]
MIAAMLFSLLFGAQNILYFDFTERPFQAGDYVVTGNVVVEGTSARLADVTDWHLPGWSARIEFYVQNAAQVQLEEYPVRVDLSMLPAEVFDIAAIDGADLRLVAADGSEITAMWLENYDFIARSGDLWLQLPTLPTGQTRIYLYLGNDAASSVGSWQEVFRYSSLKYGAWWPFPGTSQVSIAAFEPVRVQIGAGVPVDAVSQPQIVSADPGIVAANGPYSLAGDLNASDIAVPFSMVGTAFSFPAQRGLDVIEVFSPFGVAQVQLLQGETVLASATVNHLQSQSLSMDIPTGSYRLLSDSPVVAFHWTSDGYDGHPLVPATAELWGAALGTVYVTALEDNTSLTVYQSDIAVTTHTLSRDAVLTLSYGASAGSGPALHLVADHPIGALSQGDGSGGESVAFLPGSLLAREFVLPRAVSYLAVAATEPSTLCATSTADGTPLTEVISEATPRPYPNKFLYGALAAGTRLTCSAPVAVFQEDAALGDERHLLSVKDHRPFVFPEPDLEVVMSAALPHFDPGPGIVTTPELVVPHQITRWESIEFLAPTERPTGTSLRFQVSTDAGARWRIFDGLSWRDANTSDEAMAPGYLVAGFSQLEVTRSLQLRAFLVGDGADTPVLGPIAVGYRYDEGAAQLRFDPIPSPQTQGVPFPVTVSALDADGRLLEGYTSPLLLSAGETRMLPTRHEGFVGGQAVFYVVIQDAATEVTILASDGQSTAISDPFEVVSVAAAELVKIAGDGQWGYDDEPLPTPLVVRLVDAQGTPLAAYPVTFTADGGTFEGSDDATMTVETGFTGYAAVTFTPGRGPNAVTATHGELSPVVFSLRGDERHPTLYDAAGSTACSSRPGRAGGTLPALLFLAALVLLLRRPRAW